MLRSLKSTRMSFRKYDAIMPNSLVLFAFPLKVLFSYLQKVSLYPMTYVLNVKFAFVIFHRERIFTLVTVKKKV